MDSFNKEVVFHTASTYLKYEALKP